MLVIGDKNVFWKSNKIKTRHKFQLLAIGAQKNLPPGRIFIFFKNSSWSHAWVIHAGKWIEFLFVIWSTTFSKYMSIQLSTISDLGVVNFSCVVRFGFVTFSSFTSLVSWIVFSWDTLYITSHAFWQTCWKSERSVRPWCFIQLLVIEVYIQVLGFMV